VNVCLFFVSDILSQVNVDLPPQDFDSIVTKYDLKENGRFCYSEFLRHFMNSMRPKESAQSVRRKTQATKVPVSTCDFYILVYMGARLTAL
jgi:hypothetical protein